MRRMKRKEYDMAMVCVATTNSSFVVPASDVRTIVTGAVLATGALVTTVGTVVGFPREEQPMVVDGRGNVVVEENEKIIFKRADGHGHYVEFVLPDDLNELQVRNAELEKVFEDRFVFSGDEKEERELI